MLKRMIPVLAVMTVSSGQTQAVDMSRCLQIDNSDERKACFSEVYSQSKADAAAREEEDAVSQERGATEDLAPGWWVQESYDEIRDTQSFHIFAPETFPRERMSSPYTDVSARLAIACTGRSEWAYISFSGASPNIANRELKSGGYSEIAAPVKWGDTLDEVTFVRESGSTFLGFDDDESAIEQIVASDRLLVEFDWYGEGRVLFPFSLEGAKPSVTWLRSLCAKL